MKDGELIDTLGVAVFLVTTIESDPILRAESCKLALILIFPSARDVASMPLTLKDPLKQLGVNVRLPTCKETWAPLISQLPTIE